VDSTQTRTLGQIRAEIRRKARYVGRKPYSHNIVSLLLKEIDEKYGRDAMNAAIKELGLIHKGWTPVAK